MSELGFPELPSRVHATEEVRQAEPRTAIEAPVRRTFPVRTVARLGAMGLSAFVGAEVTFRTLTLGRHGHVWTDPLDNAKHFAHVASMVMKGLF